MEPPEHTDHRRAIANSFLPAQIRRFDPRFREIAKANVDRLMEYDGEVDFVPVVAFSYPMNAILEMLGVPPEDYDYMLKLTQEAFGGDDPDSKREDVPVTPEAMARQWKESVADFYQYFEVIRKDRHANPRDDLATALVTARLENGELQSERVQNDALCAIGVAGHDTTSSALSGGMHGLATFPDQFEKVKADLKLVGRRVEEPPSPLHQGVGAALLNLVPALAGLPAGADNEPVPRVREEERMSETSLEGGSATARDRMVIKPTLHHVQLKTTRLQEMMRWYETVAGFEVQFEFELGAFLFNDAANHRIVLIQTPKGSRLN